MRKKNEEYRKGKNKRWRGIEKMRKELKEKKKKWEEEGKEINDRIKTLERECVWELLRIVEKKGRRENRTWRKGRLEGKHYNEKVKRKRRGYEKEERGDIKRFKCGREGRDSDLTQTQRRRADSSLRDADAFSRSETDSQSASNATSTIITSLSLHYINVIIVNGTEVLG